MRARTPEEAVYLALQDADEKWRRELPDIARKVDRLKAQSGWTANTPTAVPIRGRFSIERCAWCDRQFVAEHQHAKRQECCSNNCAIRKRVAS